MIDQKTLARLVEMRRQIHSHPEISFQQFETRQRLKRFLQQFGVSPNSWKQMAKTALVVDLVGQAPEEGQTRCIAFRADMDALSMVQTNPHLLHKSKNYGAAHMCGHDGHMTCLLAFVPIFVSQLGNIPKNKTIRLLFQPSEEGPKSGAELMIKQGCLEGVDQVYGCHQWPTAPLGEIWCKQGAVMSECTIIKIKVTGTSGHGSEPEKLKVAVWEGINLYQRIKSYLDELKIQKKDLFISTFPIFQAGERFNVISESAYMEGSIRSFQKGLKDKICQKINEFLDETRSRGFTVDFSQHVNGPININTAVEAGHVLRVGQKVFGKGNSSHGKLPFKASEDFSYFTQVKPGAFFFLSSSRGQENPPMLHNSNFDFNDNLIPKAAQFWYELAIDRLGIKI